jgi:hypothetical protein
VPSDVIVLAFMAVVLVAALRLFGTRRAGDVGFRASDYRAKPLVTAWELRVLGEIGADLPCGYHACPQVRLVQRTDDLALDLVFQPLVDRVWRAPQSGFAQLAFRPACRDGRLAGPDRAGLGRSGRTGG